MGKTSVVASKGEKNRQLIIEAANELFYHKGYNQTTFSEVAEASGIPKGNFYYYFKSKDELLDAVIAMRLEGIRAMLAQWRKEYPEPRDRLKRYARILLNETEDVVRYGCPMGSLNVELGKTQLVLQSKASEMFELFHGWLVEQFKELGKGRDSGHLALHLLAMSQGAALLGNVYRDRKFIRREVEQIISWIDSL